MMEVIEIELFGRVQGVNLRKTIQKYAQKLGLKGFVKNRKDGSVYLIAKGEKENLEDLASFVQKNPGFSKVTKFSCEWKDASKFEFEDFAVEKDFSFFEDQKQSFMNLKRFIFRKKEAPMHVALIPDGNRRWAKSNGMEAVRGYEKVGQYKHMIDLMKEAENLGVRYLSLWGFSTENWSRDNNEKEVLFQLMEKLVDKFIEKEKENRICFKHMGRKDRLPKILVEKLQKLEDLTKNYDRFFVVLCLDYGGRDEILRAVNKAIGNGSKKIDEKDFSELLDSQGVPDPDFIIRTSGEHRLSGFMPFQGVYAELYFADVHFPDFGKDELKKAILSYVNRHRRFGGN